MFDGAYGYAAYTSGFVLSFVAGLARVRGAVVGGTCLVVRASARALKANCGPHPGRSRASMRSAALAHPCASAVFGVLPPAALAHPRASRAGHFLCLCKVKCLKKAPPIARRAKTRPVPCAPRPTGAPLLVTPLPMALLRQCSRHLPGGPAVLGELKGDCKSTPIAVACLSATPILRCY